MLWRLIRRLCGYTGDGLGAVEQVAEIAALVVLAGAWA
jgi:adenosylcobinamide-GDP ribazoletransferase